MYSTTRILNLLKDIKPELEKKYFISELGLFGSYARGDQNEKSDIDILVDFKVRIDGFDYVGLAHQLEDFFNYKIDMVSRQGIKREYLHLLKKT